VSYCSNCAKLDTAIEATNREVARLQAELEAQRAQNQRWVDQQTYHHEQRNMLTAERDALRAELEHADKLLQMDIEAKLEAAEQLRALRARVAELHGALRPFLEHARNCVDRDGGERTDVQTTVPLAWFHAARAALGTEPT
jgi:chromosome segregation ATPase